MELENDRSCNVLMSESPDWFTSEALRHRVSGPIWLGLLRSSVLQQRATTTARLVLSMSNLPSNLRSHIRSRLSFDVPKRPFARTSTGTACDFYLATIFNINPSGFPHDTHAYSSLLGYHHPINMLRVLICSNRASRNVRK